MKSKKVSASKPKKAVAPPSYDQLIETYRAQGQLEDVRVDIGVDTHKIVFGQKTFHLLAKQTGVALDSFEKMVAFVKSQFWDGTTQEFYWTMHLGADYVRGDRLLIFYNPAQVESLAQAKKVPDRDLTPFGEMMALLKDKGRLEATKMRLFKFGAQQIDLEWVSCWQVSTMDRLSDRIKLHWDGLASTFGWEVFFEDKFANGWVERPEDEAQRAWWASRQQSLRQNAQLLKEMSASLPGVLPEQVDYSQQVFSVSVPPGQAPRVDGVRQPIQLDSAESVPAPQPPSEPTIGGLSLDQARTMMYLADLHSWMPDGALPKGGSIHVLIADGLVADENRWPLTERGQAWVQAYGDAVPRKRLPFLLVLGDQDGPLMIREVLLNDLEQETLEGPVAELHKAEGRTISLIEQEKQPVLEGDLAVAEWLKAATTPMNREAVVAIASAFTVPAAVFRSKEGQAQTLGSGFYPPDRQVGDFCAPESSGASSDPEPSKLLPPGRSERVEGDLHVGGVRGDVNFGRRDQGLQGAFVGEGVEQAELARCPFALVPDPERDLLGATTTDRHLDGEPRPGMRREV